MADNLFPEDYFIKRINRNKKNNHRSLVVWFTGLSGSGKSTIAREAERRLFDLGYHTYVLDADNIRLGLNKDIGFSDAERMENLRRVAEVAKMFSDAGIILLAAFISPKEEERRMIREIIGKEDLLEMFVNCPLEICEERDVKGNYKKYREGKIKDFVGIDIKFEMPNGRDLEIRTDIESLEESVDKVLDLILQRIKN